MQLKTLLANKEGLIERYYDERLAKSNPLYARYSLQTRNTVICPLHEDTDPSMGVIKGKKGYIYHCFGCGATGTVVDFVRKVEFRHFGQRLSEEKSAQQLAAVLGFSLPEVTAEESSRVGDKLRLKRQGIAAASRGYSLAEFTQALPDIRKNPLLLDNHLLEMMNSLRGDNGE